MHGLPLALTYLTEECRDLADLGVLGPDAMKGANTTLEQLQMRYKSRGINGIFILRDLDNDTQRRFPLYSFDIILIRLLLLINLFSLIIQSYQHITKKSTYWEALCMESKKQWPPCP